MSQQTKKALSLEDIEERLIASLIDPRTSRKAKSVMEREKVQPEMMSTDNRELFRSVLVLGTSAFGGMIGDHTAKDLSTDKADTLAAWSRRIVREWRQRLRETDRTLDQFVAPERDEDDEDCLFRNRWLRRGACGMIVSTSGVGKSSITMQAADHWGAGVPMLGIVPMRPLKIGIIQSEDDDYDVSNFRDKIRIGLRSELKWSNDKIADAEQRVTFCAWDGSTGKHFVEFLRKKQLKHHFDLVIINPLHAFFGGDLKSADEVSKFLRNGIDRVIKDEETKCAVIFVHHTGKPSREKLADGDFFAGYMGSGSAELINYPRIALTITPYKEGKYPGVFNLIGSKHGDKLQWRDDVGKLTTKKVVCYANRLQRHKNDGAIFWIEPDEYELAEIENAVKDQGNDSFLKAAEALAEIFKKRNVFSPKSWVKTPEAGKETGFSRRKLIGGMNLIDASPERFGLRFVSEGRGKPQWYEDDGTGTTSETPEIEF